MLPWSEFVAGSQVSDRCPLGYLFCNRLLDTCITCAFCSERSPLPLGAWDRERYFWHSLGI